MTIYNKILYKNPAKSYLLTLQSAITRKHNTSILQRFCKIHSGTIDLGQFDWSQLSYLMLITYLDNLKGSGVSPDSLNTYLYVFRGVAKECYKFDLMSQKELDNVFSIKRFRGSRLLAGRSLGLGELRLLFSALGHSCKMIDCRNAALFGVCYGCGLRAAELANLTFDNLDDGCVTIIGKGNKERRTPIPKQSQLFLNRWLSHHPKNINNVFLQVSRKGEVKPRILQPSAITPILRAATHRLGLAKCTAHDLRRTYATNLLDCGVDVFTVQALMGHADIGTTKRYDFRGEKVKQQAISKLPFR